MNLVKRDRFFQQCTWSQGMLEAGEQPQVLIVCGMLGCLARAGMLAYLPAQERGVVASLKGPCGILAENCKFMLCSSPFDWST